MVIDERKQELQKTISFFLSIGLFVLLIYITFYLCAYIVILLPSDVWPDFMQRVELLKNTETVFVMGMTGIAAMAYYTFFILPLLLLYLYVKISKKLASKIMHHLVKE